MREVVIASAARTALGSFGGSLKDVPAAELGAIVIKEAVKRAGIDPEQVEEVVMGNVIQAGLGQNVARQATLKAGLPNEVPAMTINKVCGSGLRTVALAAQMIKAVVQLNTDGACHIEAMSIKNILPQFDLDHLDLIIIENIGNLVCPAEFDIGESLKVALLSIPEGDDKVEKYPLMFTRADALVLTKYDLINYFEFNEERVEKNALMRNDELKLFKVNSKNEEDIKEFKNWLISKIEE